MWRYLIFNTALFSLLFLVHFAKPQYLKGLIPFLFWAGLAIAAGLTSLDPLGCFLYFIFAWIVFWSGGQFKRWALARRQVLDEEVGAYTRELESKREVFLKKILDTEALGRRASEIGSLYDKVKEMSQCLDMLETFLVFGEALSRNFKFNVIKLALFDEEKPQGGLHPNDVFELHDKDFQEAFDRSLYLKDPKRVRTHLFPFDEKICETVFRQQSAFQAGDRDGSAMESIRLWPDFLPFVAQPIFIHDRIFAVLIILGIEKEDIQRLSILTDGFASEAQRVKLYEKVEQLAITDGLTGMVVRRHLVERFEEELDRARRFGFKLSFLMIDIDHFKNFNDQYGHLVGDVVLKQVAETIKKNVREIDIVGRYGGEEFGVLLVETDESGAFFVAERIRRAVADRVFRAYDENLRATISVGCSTHSPSLNDANLLVEAADSALYQAKRQGRNRVCLSHLPNA